MTKRVTKTWFALGLILPFVCSACLDDGPKMPDPAVQLQHDIEAIDAYLDANNVDAIPHSSGIRYVIHQQGSGSTITADSCVVTNYKGMLLATGTKFDENTNLALPLKGLIAGWQIGVPLLKEGDSATFYIPSGLGYGYYGYPPAIPSNANLIFGIKVVSVGRTYKSSPAPKGSCD